ncbi:hypothetical protein HYX19_03360 [Candidatus Woesearchaeota archaeon]|nr:hypothetical protein [Candidatus Woesearchaeota archaeon]
MKNRALSKKISWSFLVFLVLLLVFSIVPLASADTDTTDGGNTWLELEIPRDGEVHNIAVDPQNSNIVYIVTTNVLYKSIDGAKTWKELTTFGVDRDSEGYDGRSVSSITISPADSSIIYAGTTHGNVYKSTTSGESWIDISDKFKVISPISSISFNPKNTQEIFISTGLWYWGTFTNRPQTGEGLFKSSDGGENFVKLQNEFGSDLVPDVEVIGNTVYAVVHHAPESVEEWYGFFRSKDSGKSWQKLLDSRDKSKTDIQMLTHVTVSPNNENNIIVSSASVADKSPAFFVSFDAGDSWKLIGKESTESIMYTHELKFVNDSLVYAVDYYRAFMKSEDGGLTWKWSSNGIRRSTIYSLQVHPLNRNLVLAGTIDGALHMTYDGGNKWERIFQGPEQNYIAGIEFNPKDSNMLYFGVSGLSDVESGRYYGAPWDDTGLYTSKDTGRTWTKSSNLPHPNEPSNQLEIYSILIHPDDPDIMLVGTSSEGVYITEDGGKTWQESNLGIPEDHFYWNMEFDGPSENRAERECKEFYRKGEYKSGCFYYATRTSMSLFVNPHDKNEIWYTTLNGIFISKDLGKSWQWLSDDLKNIHTHYMAFDISDPNTIYVGTHQGAIDESGRFINSSKGLFISRDAGKTWNQVVNGPGEGYSIRAIAVNPKNPDFVVVGTEDPLFISEDKGKTWRKTELEGLKEANKIKIDATAKIIYLGTGNVGVWRGIIGFDSSQPAMIEITGISAPHSVKSGQPFAIIVSVDNIGSESGSLPLHVKIGLFESEQTVSLSKADQATATFYPALKQSGEYSILVNDIEYGRILVTEDNKPAGKMNGEEKEKNIFEKIINFFKGLFGK